MATKNKPHRPALLERLANKASDGQITACFILCMSIAYLFPTWMMLAVGTLTEPGSFLHTLILTDPVLGIILIWQMVWLLVLFLLLFYFWIVHFRSPRLRPH